MKWTNWLLVVSLVAGCSTPREPAPQHIRVADSGVQPKILEPFMGNDGTEPVLDSVYEEAPAAVGNVPGIGTFRATPSIQLSETNVGSPTADLSIEGFFPNLVGGVGAGICLTPDQMRQLSGGKRIDIHEASGVSFGKESRQVTRGIHAAQLSVSDSGAVTLHFTLGKEWNHTGDVPSS